VDSSYMVTHSNTLITNHFSELIKDFNTILLKKFCMRKKFQCSSASVKKHKNSRSVAVNFTRNVKAATV